jgi:hypothetical protein
MTRRQKIALLSVLVVVFAALQLRGLLPADAPVTTSILGRKPAGKTVAGPTAAERLAGVLQLAAPIPQAGVRDIFRRAVPRPAVDPSGPASAERKAVRPEPRKIAEPEPPPAPVSPPAPPAPPPPPVLPPPEDPMVQVKKELAAYRFVGYFRKTAGDQVLFLMKGSDVFLVKKGDVLIRGVVVADVKEREIVLQIGADRKARAALRDNSPLSVF